jgi:alanyl-tRNA synthetase
VNEFHDEFMNLPLSTIASPRGVKGIKKYEDRTKVYKSGTPIATKAALLHNAYIKKIEIDKQYPEVKERELEIQKIVYGEEKLFLNTLEIGLSLLENQMESYKQKKETVFSGKELFKLYGTYGFPSEMMREILEENYLQFDDKGFGEELEKDRTLSRESWKGKKVSYLGGIETKLPPTIFTGYESVNGKGTSVLMIKGKEVVSVLLVGDEGCIALSSTSFYGESGGQIGDSGFLITLDSTFQVLDTQKENDVVLHIGKVLKGVKKLAVSLQPPQPFLV